MKVFTYNCKKMKATRCMSTTMLVPAFCFLDVPWKVWNLQRRLSWLRNRPFLAMLEKPKKKRGQRRFSTNDSNPFCAWRWCKDVIGEVMDLKWSWKARIPSFFRYNRRLPRFLLDNANLSIKYIWAEWQIVKLWPFSPNFWLIINSFDYHVNVYGND